MGNAESYPKWDLMLITGDQTDVLGVITDLEQFLDHYGLDAKPSLLEPKQQLVVLKHGLYQGLTATVQHDRDLWVEWVIYSAYFCV